MFLLTSFPLPPLYVPSNFSLRYFPGDDFLANRQQNDGQYTRTCTERCEEIVSFGASGAFRRSIVVASATAPPRWALARTFEADRGRNKGPLNSASRGGVYFSHLVAYLLHFRESFHISCYIDKRPTTRWGISSHVALFRGWFRGIYAEM